VIRSSDSRPFVPSRTLKSKLSDRPRERLNSLGVEALSDVELIALLLRTGGSGRNVMRVARDLLAGHGSLPALARVSAVELQAFPGMGPAKSASFLAALEIGRRLAARTLQPGDPVRGPLDVFRHFYPRLRGVVQECFFVVLLDGRHRVLRECLVSQGTLTASLVHPREVFRPALREAAAAVILAHNHPSGDPSPSAEDREVTLRLAKAGDLLGIPVLDHVVIAERGHTSLREEGVLTPESNVAYREPRR